MEDALETCRRCGIDVPSEEAVSCREIVLCPECHAAICAADNVARMASETWRDAI